MKRHARQLIPASLAAGALLAGAAPATGQAPEEGPSTLTLRAADGRIVAVGEDGRLTAQTVRLQSAGGELTHTLSLGPDGELKLTQADRRTPKVQIGVTMEPVSGALASQLGFEPGSAVLISGVTPGQPADKAGLKQHDVVTGVNGRSPVTPETLRDEVSASSPGDTITFDVFRAGKRLRIDLEVEAYAPKIAIELAYKNLRHGLQIEPTVINPLVAKAIVNSRAAQIPAHRLRMDPVVVEGHVSLEPHLIELAQTLARTDPPEDDPEEALHAEIKRLKAQLDQIEALLGKIKGDRD